MVTKLDVATRALRHARITAHDEAATAEAVDTAYVILDGIIAEIGAAVTWTSATIPDNVYIPLANWLSAELSPTFGKDPSARAREKLRFFAVIKPDDRTDTYVDYDTLYY